MDEEKSERLIKEDYFTKYQAKDIDGVLQAAAKLANIYEKRNDIKLLKLSGEISKLCGIHSDTTSVLIDKKAIIVAINILKVIGEDLPAEDDLLLLCKAFDNLAYCYEDPGFMISVSNQIAYLRDTGSHVQRSILRTILFCKLEGLFSLLDGSRNNLIDKRAKEVITKCKQLLFDGKTSEPIHRELKDYFNRELEVVTMLHKEPQEMINDVMKLLKEIQSMKFCFNWEKKSELKQRHEVLLHYFTSLIPNSLSHTWVEGLEPIIELLAMGCDFGSDYFDKIYEKAHFYADKFFNLKNDGQLPDDNMLSARAFSNFGDIYYRVKDAYKTTYYCYINFLKYENIYFKNSCFKFGMDFFIDETESHYFFHHIATDRCIELIRQNHDLHWQDLYVELCKRKNLSYLAEAWQRRYDNILDVNSFLRQDISFEEICAKIPMDTVLIDFIYCWPEIREEDGRDGYLVMDEKYAYCLVFVVHSESKNCRVFYKSAVDFAPFFYRDIGNLERELLAKNITEDLLADLQDVVHIVVSTEGDMSSVSFASLPYKEGYVTDYFSVRNIGSIYDLIDSRKRMKLKDAFILTDPDLGEKPENEVFKRLPASVLESNWLKDSLTNLASIKESDILHLSDAEATLEATKDALSSKKESYSIIHFVTHGVLKDNAVGLLTAESYSNEEAILWETDLVGKSLDETALIVFSICKGGKQTTKIDDNLSGFVRFSLICGANTVIAPLSDVEGSSCPVIMNTFYKVYLESPDCRPEAALQQAIKRIRKITRLELAEMLNDDVTTLTDPEDRPFASPEHWMPWVCYSREEMR